MFHGHCDQSHLAVLPWDSLCGQDKYNPISLKNNIAGNPKGKFCLAFLLHKSQWESDLAWPCASWVGKWPRISSRRHAFHVSIPLVSCAVKLCMSLLSENKQINTLLCLGFKSVKVEPIIWNVYIIHWRTVRSELYLLSIFEDERDIIEACIAFKKKNHLILTLHLKHSLVGLIFFKNYAGTPKYIRSFCSFEAPWKPSLEQLGTKPRSVSKKDSFVYRRLELWQKLTQARKLESEWWCFIPNNATGLQVFYKVWILKTKLALIFNSLAFFN